MGASTCRADPIDPKRRVSSVLWQLTINAECSVRGDIPASELRPTLEAQLRTADPADTHQSRPATSLCDAPSLLTLRQSPNTGRDRCGFHSMSKRTLTVSFLTAGLTAGILATAVGPATAQGNPVGGG